jgi:hypothetical protein
MINKKNFRPTVRPRCTQEDYKKTDLAEIGCQGVDWTQLAQDRVHWPYLVNMVKDLSVPQKATNFLIS